MHYLPTPSPDMLRLIDLMPSQRHTAFRIATLDAILLGIEQRVAQEAMAAQAQTQDIKR